MIGETRSARRRRGARHTTRRIRKRGRRTYLYRLSSPRTRRGQPAGARGVGERGLSACATQHGKSRAAARERDRTHFARVRLGKRRSGLDAMLAAVAGDDHACVPSCVSVTIRGFSAIANARPAFCTFERVSSGDIVPASSGADSETRTARNPSMKKSVRQRSRTVVYNIFQTSAVVEDIPRRLSSRRPLSSVNAPRSTTTRARASPSPGVVSSDTQMF